jgi:dihydrofolate reductase
MTAPKLGPQIALIAAVARNGAIGLHNGLIFNEPTDQKHFRATTLGCPVIMGRKTWDSLPARFKPLPGRRNLVLSRNPGLLAPGAETAADLDQALAKLQDAPKIFVLGGEQLFALALPQAHQLVLTEVDADLAGDVFFPHWDRRQFKESSRSSHRTEAGVPYHFVVYDRR